MAIRKEMVVGCLAWAVVCVLWTLPNPASAGCVESNLCCHGRNNTCIAKGPKIRDNSLDSKDNKQKTQCFCDESCLYQKDCCTDFKEHCKGETFLSNFFGVLYIHVCIK